MKWLNTIIKGTVVVLTFPCLLFILSIEKVVSIITKKDSWVINSYWVSLLFIFLTLISIILLFTIDKLIWNIIGIYILSSMAFLSLLIVFTITQSSETLIHKVLKKFEKRNYRKKLDIIDRERIYRLIITAGYQIFYFASLYWFINKSFAAEGAFIKNNGLLLKNIDFFFYSLSVFTLYSPNITPTNTLAYIVSSTQLIIGYLFIVFVIAIVISKWIKGKK